MYQVSSIHNRQHSLFLPIINAYYISGDKKNNMTRLTGDTAGISVIIKIKISINNDNNSDNCNCWAVVEKIMLKVSNIKLLQ